MNCEYCGKSFATKGSLARHQKTIKYCIDLQSKTKPMEFKCEACDKYLTTKYNLTAHQKTCRKVKTENEDNNRDLELEHTREKLTEKESIIEKLENRIRELELDMKDVAIKAKKTTNITTNIQQNFTPITDEKLAEDATRFAKEHLLLGGQGIAYFALEGTLKNNYKVTDTSRGNTQYMNEKGEIVLDPGTTTLAKRICRSIVEPAQKINLEAYQRNARFRTNKICTYRRNCGRNKTCCKRRRQLCNKRILADDIKK